MKDTKDRIEYIDIAKGIGIVLVIVGHVVWGGNYPMKGAESISNFIYSFHMPLFFIISGLCIKDSKELAKPVLKKMARAYLLPYVVWSVIYLAVFQFDSLMGQKPSIISFNNDLFDHAISDCGLAPLWFLLALFISEVLVIAIKPLLKQKQVGYCVLGVFAGISIGCSYWYESIGEISILARNWIMGTLRIAPTTFYVLLGYLIKYPIKRGFQLNRTRWITIVVMATIQTALCWRWNEGIDVQVFKLGNPWLYFLKAVNGALLIVLIAQSVHSDVLIKLGRKTKELMILHHPPFYYTMILQTLLGKLFAPNVLGMIIISVVTTICCLSIDWICQGLRPYEFIMGRRGE